MTRLGAKPFIVSNLHLALQLQSYSQDAWSRRKFIGDGINWSER